MPMKVRMPNRMPAHVRSHDTLGAVTAVDDENDVHVPNVQGHVLPVQASRVFPSSKQSAEIQKRASLEAIQKALVMQSLSGCVI